MPLNWTPNVTTGHNFEAQVGEMLWLEVTVNDVRQEWDWRVDTTDGRLLATGTDDGRGVEAAKLAAETFAREWVARQAAALGDGWVSVEERLPGHHVEVLVASINGMTFQAVGMWHGEADEIFKDEPGWYIWNRPFTYKPDFVTHWRPLPPLAEVEG